MVVATMPGTKNKDKERPILTDNDLFDESSGYDDETGIKFAEGLSSADTRQATLLYRLFNELMGVCIVKGDPGAGKDTFGNWLQYDLKRFFPQKKMWRDEKPRKLFGKYEGLFNEEVLADDLGRMKALASGKNITQMRGVLEQAADKWVSEKGEVMLKNSIVYLTELWRYCYYRDPMDPMNITMGGLFKVKRHIDALFIGTIQLPKELDKTTCLPWVDWQVTCVKSRTGMGRFTFFVHKVKYDKRTEVLELLGSPYPLLVDAAAPKKYIGGGKIHLTKPNYQPVSEEERIVMDVIKAGYDDYDAIVELLENEGDMEEQETLATLKDLSFNKKKRAILYGCTWRTFNSKSSPQITTTFL
jgi:hypothetical protein